MQEIFSNYPAQGRRQVFICWLLLLPFYCHDASATVVLDSSVGMRQACPGEMVTYTCTVTQGFQLDWIVEPFLPAGARIRFLLDTTPIGRSVDCNGVSPPQCDNIDFVATFTNTANPTTVMNTNVADMTSTLMFSSPVRLNGTVVQCSGITVDAFPITNRTLNVKAVVLPSPPRTPSSTVQQYGRNSVTLTVQWQPPQYDGGAPVNYTITVSPGLGPVTTSGTSVPVTVPYNVIHTVRIVATNCNGSSSATMVTIRIANCVDPIVPRNGSIDPYQNTTEGAEIFFRCNPVFVPAGRMRAVCGADGRWNPDPAGLVCTFDCGLPVAPQHGSLESYTGTTEGSEVFYSCNQHLVPEGTMRAVCTRNGWNPNPADLSCTEVNCGVPITPVNGSIENIHGISTVGGTQIIFRCNECFVPAGRMSATCISSSGRWAPNPADLVCNASLIVCQEPTLATGVTVVQSHRNAVNSEIVYRCEESGFTPSSNSSLCGEDGMWSPDPSRVECRMIITEKSLPTAAAIAIAAIVCSLVMFITGALCGALITVCISRWNKKGRSSKPAPNTQEQQQMAPEYEEVDPRSQKIELKENVAYGPVKQN